MHSVSKSNIRVFRSVEEVRRLLEEVREEKEECRVRDRFWRRQSPVGTGLQCSERIMPIEWHRGENLEHCAECNAIFLHPHNSCTI